ncbi:Transketolase, thiamine diphosphate binding domain-containing protein [Fusarium redolens]|uniref:transketolase n=1 Tax=Fusarium redolens TaxID=48865 RepID=A0A9P9JP23_FUSRE|nr:Transketolase, thiamine diphosphate binding domain-containing protein [Fusarium redolens]KAH7205158.1 Transketolase, thiamine diphosphate binding domain-containing protein [Fusarium redolens]
MAPTLELNERAAVDKILVKPLPSNGSTSFANLNLESPEKHDRVLKVFRAFIADLCQQFNGGHPGSAMGMAAIGIALYKYVMRYSPNNCEYFNRDRFVLSNGHACLWQYLFMHLVGVKSMTLEQLKSYHSTKTDSLCPGHPEIENEGVEVTTGPLGQGVANAVGLAMATKNLGATYNKPGYDLVNNMTWCMIGDACLQEGVGLEAVSLAGHWRLNNLCIIYDNNSITCDGTADVANTEDINAKMEATGWNVLDVFNGDSDVTAIVNALIAARSSDKPTFINIRTTIGFGSAEAGNAKTHGAALGVDDVANIKKSFGLDPNEHFHIPQDVYDLFADVRVRGDAYEAEWLETVQRYKKEDPMLGTEFGLRVAGKMPDDWTKCIPSRSELPTEPTSSRKSAGILTNILGERIKSFLVGTADLTPSCHVAFNNKVDFQSPDLRTACGLNGNYSGRYIHYGIREHAMCAISNGLAAFNKGTFIPMTSSFFMFYLYAAPAVRMAALQGIQQIHIATHDSIGTGEDGPTHQPIALPALYRAMPNTLYIRPCDSEEVAGAFIAAIQATETPTIISLSRQNLTQFPQHSSREGVSVGAYVFVEADDDDFDVTLIGVGSEMGLTMQAKDVLLREHGIKSRVVSFPCPRLFEQQPRQYKQSVLKPRSGKATVVIEAYAANGWERRRRVKCDEGKPRCVQCSKSDRDCRYAQQLSVLVQADQDISEAAKLRQDAVPEASCSGNSSTGGLSVPQETGDAENNQLSIEGTVSYQDNFQVLVEPSVTFQLHDSINISQDDQSETSNDGRLPNVDFDFAASPLARSQVSLLNISPFEWYDLLAQDAISQIQRLNDASNGEPRWNFDESTLSRRQSPAPRSIDTDSHAQDRHGNGLGVSSVDHDSANKPWNTTESIELSPADLGFFRYYTEIVGPILDLFDQARHFTNVVPHLALRNSGLLKAILAVAAKHMSLGVKVRQPQSHGGNSSESNSLSPEATTGGGQPPEQSQIPAHMATQYYYETLQYLSQTLLYPSYAESHEILATAIMISTYEMFDAGGTSTSGNWERHLRGAFWIQRSQDNDGESIDGLRRAVWWAWLRQDIWAAFRAGRPTLTIWRPKKRLENLDSDELATRMVYICAKCVEFAALDKTSPSQDIQQKIEHGNRLLQALENWYHILPCSYKPVMVTTEHDTMSRTPSTSKSQTRFRSVWFHPPNHAGAMQMYHFSKAIVLLNQPSTGGLNAYRQRQKGLNESLNMVCSIANACQRGEPAMAFVNVQAIFAVGQCVQMPEKQAELLDTLDRMLEISKFPATGLVADLKCVWQE